MKRSKRKLPVTLILISLFFFAALVITYVTPVGHNVLVPVQEKENKIVHPVYYSLRPTYVSYDNSRCFAYIMTITMSSTRLTTMLMTRHLPRFISVSGITFSKGVQYTAPYEKYGWRLFIPFVVFYCIVVIEAFKQVKTSDEEAFILIFGFGTIAVFAMLSIFDAGI